MSQGCEEKKIRVIKGTKGEAERVGGWKGRVKKDAEEKRKGDTV